MKTNHLLAGIVILVSIGLAACGERAAPESESDGALETPEAMARVRKYGVGTWNDWKFEARFSGPWNADRDVLRRLAHDP